MKKSMKIYSTLLIGIMSLYGCSSKMVAYKGEQNFKSESGIPDYSKLEYWAANPKKWDPSDSIPEPLRGKNQDKIVDVFFIHPTTLTELKDTIYKNARIDDSIINYKTDYSSILYQASVFNENARIYAPRYRQAHINMYFTMDSVQKYNAFNLAYSDVKAAFEYYLKNENNGRPIIIASHSQGTTHAMRLMKEYFDNKDLSKRLVCAYLVGMGVKKNMYEVLQPCEDSTQIGCYNTWRTYREDFVDPIINHVDTTIAVVNPINWKTDNSLALSENQKGAILYNFNKIFYHTQNAKAEGNALWISHPKFPGFILYRTKNYHVGDINLFYMDIREDVSRRITHYFNTKSIVQK